MSDTLVVDALEQLKPLLNDKKVLEIVVREKNKRIKAFQKVALNDLPQTEAKELAEKAVQALNKNNLLNQKNLKMIQQVAKMQQLGLVLNGLNLAATCAGFAIMNEKLERMSAEINQQINQVKETVKQGHDVQTGYEFNKVLSDYTEMLDSKRRQQPYPEKDLRKLVDSEYNVLLLLISVFRKDIASDKQTLIVSMFSLLSMLTVSLKYFDEQYYLNNHEVLGDQDPWHSSQGKWMSIYDTMTEPWFVEKLQDYGFFESKLTTIGVDIYYTELMDQVMELRHDVEDNQELVVAIGDVDLLAALRENSSREIKETIESALKEAFAGQDSPEATEMYNAMLKQVVVM